MTNTPSDGTTRHSSARSSRWTHPLDTKRTTWCTVALEGSTVAGSTTASEGTGVVERICSAASSVTRSRIWLTSIARALWSMNPTIARIATMPSSRANEIDRLGTTASTPSPVGVRTERRTTRQ